MPHHFTTRVYYEDTDLAGIVYYANYLKFIERARTEWVRSLGIDQTALKSRGIVFAVARIEADYLAPARFDDMLDIATSVETTTAARLTLRQTVSRDGQRLFSALVTLVAIGATGTPVRLPATIRRQAHRSAQESRPKTPL